MGVPQAEDIVKRLRERAWAMERFYPTSEVMREAAAEIERLRSDYRAVCRALCFALTIPPDDIIADSGEEAWMLVGHDAVRGKAVVP
jgi:hypothetical protein